MELWFSEKHTENVKLSIKVKRHLANKTSDFQQIDVFESEEFGRFLTLDGLMMMTEKDEFIYHEMMVHVPMAVNPGIENVLVIGAGDGGISRELIKYDGIKKIDVIEIDKAVVDICVKYLPHTACGFDDDRVNIYYQDGLKFIREPKNEYDLIIVDSTDPFGPGEGLFTMEFYGNCYKALTDDGILINQHESPFYREDSLAVTKIHKRIVHSFDIARVYQAHIPTYPSGHWLFGFASKTCHPIRNLRATEWKQLGILTKYYNTNLHKGAFYLPNYVEELLRNVE
ncbi:MAG: polyamine aminopropyltransferase [Oscillospiraceae bacterium]|nr:polyamine aminopropyltransferase [Oscillospiraceae bacterium]